MLRLRTAGVTAAAMLALAACATTAGLEAPKVTVDRVRIDRMTAADTQFTLVVGIVNPNDREIMVEAIDADLRIEEVPVGTAHLAAPVRLPPRGQTSASLIVRTGLSAALRAAAEAARRAEALRGTTPTVRYAVSGTAAVDGGRVIPFARSGEFAWTRNTQPSP
ncbi:MAG: LEA type 2 family protein [Betaproteobacteria bacterium]